jgi:uncharacterized Tic20 family protein
MTDRTDAVTQDEALLAASAHLFGLLVAFIVWVTQKDKSPHVRFQSILAMSFDLLTIVITSLAAGTFIVIIIGMLILAIGDIAIFGSQANPIAELMQTLVAGMTATPFLLVCLIIPVAIITIGARIFAAAQTIQGKSFFYPWLGESVGRAMGYLPTASSQ